MIDNNADNYLSSRNDIFYNTCNTPPRNSLKKTNIFVKCFYTCSHAALVSSCKTLIMYSCINGIFCYCK